MPDFIFRLSLPLNHRQAMINPTRPARAAVRMKVVMMAAAKPTEQSVWEDLVRGVEGEDEVCEGAEVWGASVEGAAVAVVVI